MTVALQSSEREAGGLPLLLLEWLQAEKAEEKEAGRGEGAGPGAGKLLESCRLAAAPAAPGCCSSSS
jgi:hypothetical protein